PRRAEQGGTRRQNWAPIGADPSDSRSCFASIYCAPYGAHIASTFSVVQSELFHHVIACEAGGLAIDCRRDIVALFQVKAGGLDPERRQRHPTTAASSPLFFRHGQAPAANPGAAPILGQKKPGDVEKPEFRSAVEPADDLA